MSSVVYRHLRLRHAGGGDGHAVRHRVQQEVGAHRRIREDPHEVDRPIDRGLDDLGPGGRVPGDEIGDIEEEGTAQIGGSVIRRRWAGDDR